MTAQRPVHVARARYPEARACPATFFLIGENIRRFRRTAARIVLEAMRWKPFRPAHHPFALQSVSEMKAQVTTPKKPFGRPPVSSPVCSGRPGLRSPWMMHVLERDSLIT